MAKTLSPRGCLVPFAIVWCAFIGVFDGILGYQAFSQLDAARRFVPTPAKIVSSEIERNHSSDGTTFRPLVTFEYDVQGRTYRADTVHFAVWGSSDRSEAEAIVRHFPAGAQTTAYHDPRDPARAVLMPGAEHLPWFMLIFLTPFHCVGLGLWIGIVTMRPGDHHDAVLRRTIRRDDGTRVLIRSTRAPLWLTFLGTLGVGAFVAVFIVGIAAGFSPPAPLVFAVYAGLVLLALAASALSLRTRRPDTILDRARRTIGRPGALRSDRFGVFAAPTGFDQIREITVESTSRGEVNGRPHFRHTVRAVPDNGREPLEVARVSGPAGFAEPLAAWIREQIGLPETAP